jgi:hypothetical protein
MSLNVKPPDNRSDRSRACCRAWGHSTFSGGYPTSQRAVEPLGSLDSVKVLLANGANPNARLDSGQTPADLAELLEHGEIAKTLRPITDSGPK